MQKFDLLAIGNRVEAIKEAKGLRWEDIAERGSIHRAQIDRLRNGTFLSVNTAVLEKVASGLDVPLALLLGISAEGVLHPLAFRTALFLHEEIKELEGGA